MPRKQKSDQVRLLEGRSPGRDSGGRLVKPSRYIERGFPVIAPPPPPRREVAPPRMPTGLPPAVSREWRRVVRELQERDTMTMPAQDVLEDYCRTLVRLHQLATALDNAVPGTVAWSRLSATEDRLAKRVAEFCSTYFAEPEEAPPPEGNGDPGSYQPFGPPETWPIAVRASFGMLNKRDNDGDDDWPDE